MSEYPYKMGGEALSRQISMSLVETPQTTLAYREFFRRDSNREDGWIESRIGDRGEWIRRWFIFDDGVLKYGMNSLDSDDQLTKISMDRVSSIRTDGISGDTTILVNTSDFKLYLRFPNADEMNKWKFYFQKSIAVVLAHLITSSGPIYDDRPSWAKQASGDFRHNKKRASFAENKTVRRFGDLAFTSRAFTTEDVNGESSERPAFLDENANAKLSSSQQIPAAPAPQKSSNSGSHASSFASSAIIAMSPAIPISAGRSLGAMEDAAHSYTEKLASSYKDPDLDRNNLLIIHTRSMSPNHSSASSVASPRQSEDHFSEADHDDQDMQFFFEDQALVRSRSRSISSELIRSPTSPIGGLAGRKSPRQGAMNSRSPRSSVSGSIGVSLTSISSITHHAAAHASRFIQWRSGYHSKIGPKKTNEDACVCLPYIDHRISDNAAEVDYYSHAHHGGGSEDSGAYFAIFDGHSGVQAATYLQEKLLDSICRHEQFHSNLVEAIAQTCCEVDAEVLKYCRKERLHCGTTALGAFIIRSKLIVFNIGDCKAILYSNGRPVEMSDSHSANRPDEAARIKAANGWVTEEKELFMDRLHRMDLTDPAIREKAKAVTWQTIHRVVGDIAVSRSIGDPDYKGFTPGEVVQEYLAWPADHDHTFSGDLLIPNPEFRTHDLAAGDEFLVMGSDGLWDVLTPAEICHHVSIALAANKNTTLIAEEMCALALKLGSSDNVTCIVVQFVHS